MEIVRHKPKLSSQRIVKKMESALIYKNELHGRCFPQLEPPLYPSSLWLPGPRDLPKYPMTPGLSFPQEESIVRGGINFSIFCPDILVRQDNNENLDLGSERCCQVPFSAVTVPVAWYRALVWFEFLKWNSSPCPQYNMPRKFRVLYLI